MARLSSNATRDPEWASPEQETRGGDGDALLAACNIRRQRMEPIPDETTLGRFWREWCRWKTETGRLDFTDLIEQALEGEGDPLSVDVLFVDEAQDLSKLEMALALEWGSHSRELVTVGDPDQNLYEWRGSHPSAFTDPPAASERTLAQSYRVPAAVHSYAVSWIEQVSNRPPIEYLPTSEEGAVTSRPEVDWRRPDNMLRTIVEADGSTMVLASCSYMLQPTITMLREARIPFHNPYRPTAGAWNPMRSAARVRALLRGPGAWTWDDLRRALEPLDARQAKLSHGIKAHVEGTCQERVVGGASRAEEIVPIGFLVGMFKDDSAAAAFGAGDLDWWESCLLERFRSSLSLPLAAARDGKIDAEPKVIIGTIHSVKGGEADSVIVFPDLSMGAYWGDEGTGGWGTGQRDPILRQFYVAFTRARRELVLCGEASSIAVDFRAVS